MAKWKTIQVRQELLEAAKKTVKAGRYQSLSEFVSDAIRVRLDKQGHSQQLTETQVEPLIIRERLLYNSHHLWAMVTPEGTVRVGLSDYVKRHLKGIAMTQIKPVGCDVRKGESFGVVKTPWHVFDLYAPVSGRIIKINLTLQVAIIHDHNDIPWIAEIKPLNRIKLEEELRALMLPHQYKDKVSTVTSPQSLGITKV